MTTFVNNVVWIDVMLNEIVLCSQQFNNAIVRTVFVGLLGNLERRLVLTIHATLVILFAKMILIHVSLVPISKTFQREHCSFLCLKQKHGAKIYPHKVTSQK
jgi:hypothetical protein